MRSADARFHLSRPRQNPRPVLGHRHHARSEPNTNRPSSPPSTCPSTPSSPALPAFTIGSIASTMPSFNRGFSFLPVHVVRNLRLLVQLRPDPWPTYSRTIENPFAVDVLLHRAANIEQPVPGPHLVDRQFQRLLVTFSSRFAASFTSPTGR